MTQSASWAGEIIRKNRIKTIQVNLGNRCNQRCRHCHIGASPQGDRNMEKPVAEHILRKLFSMRPPFVEFTGGAPELNLNLEMFVKALGDCGVRTLVRTNLTALDDPRYSLLMDIFYRNRTKLIASFPSCCPDTTDRQRGSGVFNRSLSVLRELNAKGYGTDSHELDLVYNPEGAFLPPSEEEMETDYRMLLEEFHGIRFNSLISITNSPIGGFRQYLLDQGRYDDYMKLLTDNFNPETLQRIMCRSLLSVDYQGFMYDCDFNLALGLRIKGYENVKFWEIDFEEFSPEITCGEHCYACTVNSGSSCHGALLKKCAARKSENSGTPRC